MRKLLLLFFVVLAIGVSAQNEQQAKQILLSSATNLQKTPLKAAFNLTFLNQRKAEKHSGKGTLVFSGKKFSVATDEMETFFDGKTQWVYTKAIDEVTITEPTEQELREINPLLLVSDCSRTHRIAFEKQPSEDQKFWHIYLYPLDQKADYFRVKIQINKADKLPRLLEISQKNGDIITFSASNFTKLEKADDALFRFDQKKFPSAEINDLR